MSVRFEALIASGRGEEYCLKVRVRMLMLDA
jgi:hypothetical protein